VIMSSRSIQLLDEKVVPDNQRDYLHSLSEQKKLKRKNAAAAKGQPVKLTTSEEKFAVLHRAPAFPYAPKVLTLRTTAGHAPSGSISAAQLGGMGFGKKSAMLREGAGGVSNFAAFPPPHASAAAMSQFADDDPNLGGGGGGFEEYEDSPEVRAQYSRAGSSASSGGVQQQSSSLSASSSQPHLTPAELESLDPIPGLPFTGDPTRLHYLLQTRGLVSALGSTMVSEAAQIVAESARQRRANMNAMNAKPNGWDGGRSTQSRGGTKP
jgi:hypothetical protein